MPLEVQNRIVITFFTAVVAGMATAIAALWMALRACEEGKVAHGPHTMGASEKAVLPLHPDGEPLIVTKQ